MQKTIAIVGGGPAGLRAAEMAARGGAAVTVYDAKASVGRKFLVAGGGGLNLTKHEPLDVFETNYTGGGRERWHSLLAGFDSETLRAWAADMGIETFVATSKRVYPKEMKAAPLLRRWVQRLRASGVKFAMHHRWVGMQPSKDGVRLRFRMPEGEVEVQTSVAILALGGGSWPETGSDGTWVEGLKQAGVNVAPLAAANCGWEVDWPSELLAEAEGLPLKNVTAQADGYTAGGELMITRYGLEGGVIYQLGAVLRAMETPEIAIDLKPALSVERLIAKLGPIRRNFLYEALDRWKLSPAAVAVLRHHPARDGWTTAHAMADAVKHCRIALGGPRPIAEAISSAGGVRWEELDEQLMLRRLPGVFLAGEMIDWEAPTGGYLMQGAFATGTRAGTAALAWLTR